MIATLKQKYAQRLTLTTELGFTEDQIIEFLCWAVGRPGDEPLGELPLRLNSLQREQFDKQLFWLLFNCHRIVHRFLARCSEERPYWFNHSLEVQYRAAARQVELENSNQETIANGVARICLENDVAPPLFFKGFTNFARTNNKNCLHQSGDVDIFAEDPKKLTQLLVSYGYDITIVNCPPGGLDHEYAQFCRKGAEIHNFFPVFRYPKGIENEDINPKSHPGTWYQNLEHEYISSYPTVGKIFYQDLIDDAVPSLSSLCPDVLVPSPEAAAFLQCCHLHREMCFAGACGVVSLYELADIQDNLHDPKFSTERFFELVNQFDIWGTVAVLAALLQDCFGETNLPLATMFSRIPSNTIRFAGYIGMLPRPRRILLPFHLEQVVEWLGSNSLKISNDFVNDDKERSRWIEFIPERKMVMLNNAKELDFSLHVKIHNSELSFRVKIPKKDLEENKDSCYQFGMYYVNPRTPKWIEFGKDSCAHFSSEFLETEITMPLQGAESHGILCLSRIIPRVNLYGHTMNSFFYIPFSLNAN